MSAPAVLSRREFTVGGLLLAAGLAAGCGGPSGSPAADRTLRIGQYWPPTSLDPAKAGGESQFFLQPAYDPLIVRAADGSYQPGLATAWRYLGTGNTAFEITLRDGVTFSDGSPLTAAGLKASIEHFRKSAGQAAAFLAPIATMTATQPLVLRLTLNQPHPLLPALFTQDYLAGDVISPAGTGAPADLATRTSGAGPYVLLPAETVADDHYTYGPNPKYWNAAGRFYDKITVKVLPNENTALAALKTGQVDVVAGSYAIAGGAKAAGFAIASSPAIVMGLQLNDRAGTLCPPLADVRVRQALNYAVDRAKITAALLGEYGVPVDQPSAPGQDGFSEQPFYTHDPGRARRLLADAGHAGGFALPVVIPSAPGFPGDLAQAIASDLQQVGVTLRITAKEPAAASTALTEFPASTMGWGVLPAYFMGRGLWLKDAIGMNPFHSSDPELESLDRQAAAADGATRPGLDRQIVRRVVELGWFLPVCLSPGLLFYRDTVGVDPVPGKPFPSVAAWHPAGRA
ncbi:ABC transporter substrate-binding protein [Amycolatopsis vancoresmycina]|uniref:Putative ABC transporter solute binding component n=1 Tax=Amycolatopsis vancoresmycina DSM 44592 TaxID=1292037 RepID=R1FKF7_9PSEU|nr:ABC transporter substrate-binding protein [Amycolatopsis vancoresmycina]EOD60033.1 putative ABC transporter solute binding component [Amycolatopsis vancoresmycina DSM 44592]